MPAAEAGDDGGGTSWPAAARGMQMHARVLYVSNMRRWLVLIASTGGEGGGSGKQQHASTQRQPQVIAIVRACACAHH